ncbi:MAG: energy transducer TonB, partial [Bacteroidales bacterium]
SQDELASTKIQISIADVQGTNEEKGIDIADLEEHKTIVQEKKEEIFRVADQMPEFPGGSSEMYDFIKQNLKYPSSAREYGIQGTVVVEFVVNREGKVGNIKVIVDPHPSLSSEAIRVVKLMPQWIPGKRDGKNVSTYFTLPIRFSFQ